MFVKRRLHRFNSHRIPFRVPIHGCLPGFGEITGQSYQKYPSRRIFPGCVALATIQTTFPIFMSKRPLTALPDADTTPSFPSKRSKHVSTNISALTSDAIPESIATTVIKVNTQGVFLVVAVSQPSKTKQKPVEWLLLLDSNKSNVITLLVINSCLLEYSCLETTTTFIQEQKIAAGYAYDIRHFVARVNKTDVNIPFYRTTPGICVVRLF